MLGGGVAAVGVPRPHRLPGNQAKVEQHLSFCHTCCGELEFAKELRGFLASQSTEELPPTRQGPLERFVADL
jgi:hypothetical protein